jgi:hypothetical protein
MSDVVSKVSELVALILDAGFEARARVADGFVQIQVSGLVGGDMFAEGFEDREVEFLQSFVFLRSQINERLRRMKEENAQK